jgi:Bacterial EndoU nuclease
LISKFSPSKTMNQISNSKLVQALSILVALGGFAVEANAQAFFPQPKTFTLTKSCNATTSISGSNPINFSSGTAFTAVAENNNPGTHAYIEGSGFSGRRWMALSCGTYGTPTGGGTGGGTGGVTLPPGTGVFFDNVSNPVTGLAYGSPADATPVAPVLNSFDNAVNTLCGAPGTVVSSTSFKTMMNANPAVLANIKSALGGFLVSGRTTTAAFLDDLTNVWFAAKGFDHVLCGEPSVGGSIGGLHFAGRYLELQQKGLAGRLTGNLSREEVVPGAVYTIGAKVKVGSGYSESSVKGYGYTLNAEELLTFAAKAYKTNPNTTSTSKACHLKVTDNGKTFTTVFVAKQGGIRTFYPDATPGSNPTCN